MINSDNGCHSGDGDVNVIYGLYGVMVVVERVTKVVMVTVDVVGKRMRWEW